MLIEAEVLQLYTAVMQIQNWNDLRYLLALRRARTIAGAARLLNVDGTTVSRRLDALKRDMGVPLYVRQRDGTSVLTAKGAEIVQYVEAIEHQVDRISQTLGSRDQDYSGTVRLTSVPILVNRLFAPRVGSLIRRHSQLEIELIPDSRNLSLTRREADLAVRLARPTTGGTKVKAKRIGQLDYAIYASREYAPRAGSKLPWIIYEDAMAHVAQDQWMRRAAKTAGEPISGLKIHDSETALEAALAGLGKTLLPKAIADSEARLRQLSNESETELPSRPVWLLGHADQLAFRRMAAVAWWAEDCLKIKKPR